MSLIAGYFTDTIDIILLSKDENGIPIENVQAGISARVEFKNRMVRNEDGQEVFSNATILVESENIIDYNSVIRIKTIRNKAVRNPDKKYGILMLSKPHGFDQEFYKIYL